MAKKKSGPVRNYEYQKTANILCFFDNNMNYIPGLFINIICAYQ